MATDDVAALQERIAELEAQTKTPKRRFDGRGFTAWVLLVIAAILFPISLTAFWAQKTLFDTASYVQTVAPLSQDPTIRQAVGTQITTAITNSLDAQAKVSELLQDYPKLQPLSGPIAAGLNNLVGTTVDKVLASDQFDTLWVKVNTRVQEAALKALSGDTTGAVTLQDGKLVLDTGDIINEVKQRLVDRGLSWAANVPIPPAADRDVVLLQSDQLAQAQLAYKIAQPIARWLIFAVLLLFVVAVLVSRRRARMVIGVGVSLVLGALVIRLLMAYGQTQIEVNLSGTSWAVAQDAFFTILTQYLLTAVRATFVLGVVLAIVGWYLSGTASATATRTYLTKVISGAGAGAGDTALGRIGAFFARTRTFWRAAIVGLAVLVLVASAPLTGSTILWTAVLAVVAFVVLEFLVAAGRASIEGGSEGGAAVEAGGSEPVAVPDVPTVDAEALAGPASDDGGPA
jgi:hypothetical protein